MPTIHNNASSQINNQNAAQAANHQVAQSTPPFQRIACVSEMDETSNANVDYANLRPGEYMKTEGLTTCVAIALQTSHTDNNNNTTYPTTLIHADGGSIADTRTNPQTGLSNSQTYINKILDNALDRLGRSSDIEMVAIGGCVDDADDIADYNTLQSVITSSCSAKGIVFSAEHSRVPALDTLEGDDDDEDSIEFSIGANFAVKEEYEG